MTDIVRSFATGQVRTSPLARQYATARGLDPTTVNGSGSSGRVILRDVVAAVREEIDRRDAGHAPSAAAELTLHITADASRLVHFAASSANPESCRVSDLVLFTVARTLPGHPAVNAHYLETVIRQYSTVDLGIVRAEFGGFTIRRADTATIGEIAWYRSRSPAAKHGTFHSGEQTANPAATFTCAVFDEDGPDLYTPLLIPPQVGLLGIGPVTAGYGNSSTAGPRINLSLTIDHRALDGVPATRFLRELVRRLETFDPALF